MKVKGIETLFHYDGPQVVLLYLEPKSYLLCLAVNKEPYNWPMFCVFIDEKYINKKVDLFNIFNEAKEYFFIDYSNVKLDKDIILIKATKEESKDPYYWPEPGFIFTM